MRKWQRIAVLKQLRSETLAEYGKNQKVFDERTNEWTAALTWENLMPTKGRLYTTSTMNLFFPIP